MIPRDLIWSDAPCPAKPGRLTVIRAVGQDRPWPLGGVQGDHVQMGPHSKNNKVELDGMLLEKTDLRIELCACFKPGKGRQPFWDRAPRYGHRWQLRTQPLLSTKTIDLKYGLEMVFGCCFLSNLNMEPAQKTHIADHHAGVTRLETKQLNPEVLGAGF